MRLNIGLTTDQYDLLQFFHLFHKSIQKHFRLMPRFHWSQKVHFFHQTCGMTIKYSLKLILKNSGRFRWFLCLKSITFNVRFRHFLTGNLGHSTSLMKKQMHFFDQWYLGFNLKCFEIFFVVCIGEKYDITASACLSWTWQRVVDLCTGRPLILLTHEIKLFIWQRFKSNEQVTILFQQLTFLFHTLPIAKTSTVRMHGHALQ